MYLVDVIPIARRMARDTLTYFSSKHYEEGALVSVPLRSRKISALIVQSREVGSHKAKLRTANHQLRKISSQVGARLLSRQYIRAVIKYSDYLVASPGETIFRLVPQVALSQAETLAKSYRCVKKPVFSEKSDEQTQITPTLIHAPQEERYAFYKTKMREALARGCSVLVIAPSIGGARALYTHLTKGIEQYSVFITGSDNRKEFTTSWHSSLSNIHPKVIIGTTAATCTPRPDISLIIVENEADRAWKSPGSPYPDYRLFLEILADCINAEIILGGSTIRPETFDRWERGLVVEMAEPRFRVLPVGNARMIDMRKSHNVQQKKFEVMGSEVRDMIADSASEGERVFLYASRQGLHPLTVCHDCGYVVTCARCSAPAVLRESRSSEHSRYFLCRKCGEVSDAKRTCAKCNSWNLVALGIGADLVEKEVSRLFSNRSIVLLTRETAPTQKKASDIITKFSESRGAILVGTEMAVHHLIRQNVPIEHAAVISIDSLLALPDFRAGEHAFGIILAVRSLASKTFLLQTRRSEDTTLEHALRGDILGFYRSELAIRKALRYPPFSTLIKLQVRGNDGAVKKEASNLEQYLAEYKPIIYHSFTKTIRGKEVMNILLKLPPTNWPDNTLSDKLRSLPPHIDVEVDPESIL